MIIIGDCLKSEIITGDCLEKMREMEANSIDCILTDPPYGLHFMGKDWDKFSQTKIPTIEKKRLASGDFQFRDRGVPQIDTANAYAGTYDERRNDEFQTFMTEFGREALRIVKPGGHMLMFGAPRRYHRQACGLENAGWEIKDCIMWMFLSGFPKSHNFGKKIGGEWNGFGTALKPMYEPIIIAMKPVDKSFKNNAFEWGVAGINIDASRIDSGEPTGRWPGNIIIDENSDEIISEKIGKNASRYFYCAKASRSERNEGLEGLDAGVGALRDAGRGTTSPNNHPTVKPLSLLEYLIKLVMPPKDGVLLDPFAGSGSTVVAAKRLGCNAIGIELSEDYAQIAKARVHAVKMNNDQL